MQKLKSADGANGIKPKTFNRLLKAINRSLHETKNSIDTHAAVEKYYGDDASLFGEKDSATDMLANFVKGSIEKVNESIKDDIEDILENEKVESKLLVLDKVMDEQRRQEWTHKNAEDEYRRSVQNAIERSTLPDGMTVDHALEFQAYTIKSQARDRPGLKIKRRRTKRCRIKLKKRNVKFKNASNQWMIMLRF